MKSHVSELLELATIIYIDGVAKCTDVSLDIRDLDTLRSRTEHEGLSFLTITLPDFGKDFDRSLSEGQIEPTFFRSFRKNGGIPAFLQGILVHVFERDGRIKDEPCVAAISCIRQITYAFKKLQVECTPERVRKTLTKFASVERVFEEAVTPEDLISFNKVSHCLWNNLFALDSNILARIIPRHGPGAVAETLTENGKYRMQRWHERLEPYFPLLDFAFANADARFAEEFQDVTLIPEDEESPVKVIPVPKTLKGPRIIAIEPACMQYTQQAISRELVALIESYELTRGHINFTDQTVNRNLALNSSKDKRFATLDLSSASDRVPYTLAISMFDSNPDLRDAISACRSMRAKMPDGTVLSLKRFSSMGSALCFPIESMYFYTVCVVALLRSHNLPETWLNVRKVAKQVYIYGDDIIIPTDTSDVVTETLQKYYCKVNVHKSFSVGNFRESCGMDAFDGEEVTPTYIRRTIPRNKRTTSELLSALATSNLLYQKGYWKASLYLLSKVERVLGKLPILGKDSAGLGKVSFQRIVSAERWNLRIHTFEVKAWTVAPVKRRDPLEGYPALLKCLLKLEGVDETPTSNDNHLERTALRGAVTLKRRWTQPY